MLFKISMKCGVGGEAITQRALQLGKIKKGSRWLSTLDVLGWHFAYCSSPNDSRQQADLTRTFKWCSDSNDLFLKQLSRPLLREHCLKNGFWPAMVWIPLADRAPHAVVVLKTFFIPSLRFSWAVVTPLAGSPIVRAVPTAGGGLPGIYTETSACWANALLRCLSVHDSRKKAFSPPESSHSCSRGLNADKLNRQVSSTTHSTRLPEDLARMATAVDSPTVGGSSSTSQSP